MFFLVMCTLVMQNINLFEHKFLYLKKNKRALKKPISLKINQEALVRFTEFSNLCLCVYTPYAHKNSNQSLIILSDTSHTCFCLFWQHCFANHLGVIFGVPDPELSVGQDRLKQCPVYGLFPFLQT